jgi:hypothetical protein
MDIEDLFNEDNYQHEESKQLPLVIPEFGQCGGGQGSDDEEPAVE